MSKKVGKVQGGGSNQHAELNCISGWVFYLNIRLTQSSVEVELEAEDCNICDSI